MEDVFTCLSFCANKGQLGAGSQHPQLCVCVRDALCKHMLMILGESSFVFGE